MLIVSIGRRNHEDTP